MEEQENKYKLELSEKGYLTLIQKVFDQKTEERELALDRYRAADEQMESPEQFVLMGKNAVSFLDLASKSTTDLAGLAKEVKSIVYKENSTQEEGEGLSAYWKMSVTREIEKAQKAKEKE